MRSARKMCFDRILPGDLNRPNRVMMINGRTRAIAPVGKQWINGSTLRIRFMQGTEAQKDMVRDIAPEWTRHANLDFEFTDDPRAEIRVTFDPNDGAWSYVGTDNSGIPLHAATLNLGWQDASVILHEFGHMIGLAHEHQNPDGGIIWNEAQVIADLSGPPNFWDEPTIRHNVLDKYSADQVHGTTFDPKSIMLYAFPDNWTSNTGATSENNALSDRDVSFIASEKMYPGRNAPGPSPAIQPLDVFHPAAQEIAVAGEEDVFQFSVGAQGRHVVETSGSTDVVVVLFGPDNKNLKIAEDDDGGEGRNARIAADLGAGEYYVAVRHVKPTERGAYRIMVSAI
jgi:Astacin (Peptidase family M12A)/Bacterial pre-peptidase C-terminal domain